MTLFYVGFSLACIGAFVLAVLTIRVVCLTREREETESLLERIAFPVATLLLFGGSVAVFFSVDTSGKVIVGAGIIVLAMFFGGGLLRRHDAP